MPIDLQAATSYLSSVRPSALARPNGPARDYLRSPAAATIGALAADQGLFSFHYEHREDLDLPASFVAPDHQPDPPLWVAGALPEPKYQSFRHDLAVGSFHPGHRGKWTTHELCHALVGFGWAPGASRLFHATACRLSELLPVVLYYFSDEIRLRRCPDHQGGGALFRSFCPVCEELADQGPRPWSGADDRALAQAADYLNAELAAVSRTRALGRPVAHRWGSLDLCTDGIAYAAGHSARLNSVAFHRFAEMFLVDGGGLHSRLDDLEERVVAVSQALHVGEPLHPLAPSPQAGRWRWTTQDVAWRMIWAGQLVSPDAAAIGDRIIHTLASAPPGPQAIEAALKEWEAEEDAGLLLAEQVFAVGYPLPGFHGSSLHQLDQGLRSAAPLVMDLFDDAGLDPVSSFQAADSMIRRPLADRFAGWLAHVHPALCQLGEYEAALVAPAVSTPNAGLGTGDGDYSWAPGVKVLRHQQDTSDLAAAVERGEAQGVLSSEGVDIQLLAEAKSATTILATRRDSSSDVALVQVDAATDRALQSGTLGTQTPATASLAELGMIAPARWPV